MKQALRCIAIFPEVHVFFSHTSPYKCTYDHALIRFMNLLQQTEMGGEFARPSVSKMYSIHAAAAEHKLQKIMCRHMHASHFAQDQAFWHGSTLAASWAVHAIGINIGCRLII